MENFYYYWDSESGRQNKKFKNLSEVIKYIEYFGHHGDKESKGCVYFGEDPLIEYIYNEKN